MSDVPTEQTPEAESGSGGMATDSAAASLTPLGQHYLDQTRPWVRFMSVVTFVSAGFMALVGLVIFLASIFGGLASRETGGLGPLVSAIGGGLMALLYLALACVYIAPGMFLWRYASAIQSLKASATAARLEDALKHQRSFWRFVGILTVVAVVVCVLGVGLAILIGALGAMMAARP